VEAEVVDESFLTNGMLGESVTGFHCHTYGEIRGNAQPVFFSRVKRTDYTDNPRKILSGARNDEGNVVGTMVHASLDENPALTQNILQFMDATENDIQEIENANQELVKKIKREVGIGLDMYSEYRIQNTINPHELPPFLMIASTGSDSGKTFLTTGVVGVLRKKGYRVGVLKVGPDIRDLVPALYLNKEKMEDFASIQIGGLGWKDLEEIITEIRGQKYDLILVEGVMSIFTGLLNEKTPFSAAEIARAGNIPTLMVTDVTRRYRNSSPGSGFACEHDAETGYKNTGVILNKVYHDKIAETASTYIKNTTGLEWVGRVPKPVSIKGWNPRSGNKTGRLLPESHRTVEKYLDVDRILKMAEKPQFTGYYPFNKILKGFCLNQIY
jgi:cobyrinic acid a,c-diamide synthase